MIEVNYDFFLHVNYYVTGKRKKSEEKLRSKSLATWRSQTAFRITEQIREIANSATKKVHPNELTITIIKTKTIIKNQYHFIYFIKCWSFIKWYIQIYIVLEISGKCEDIVSFFYVYNKIISFEQNFKLVHHTMCI